jgi:hypothetical protein
MMPEPEHGPGSMFVQIIICPVCEEIAVQEKCNCALGQAIIPLPASNGPYILSCTHLITVAGREAKIV